MRIAPMLSTHLKKRALQGKQDRARRAEICTPA
jgi:hypothetical protein